MDFGPQLRERRERFGFSTQQVAALAGLSRAEVEAAEEDRALKLAVIHALGRALAFDPAAFLRGESPGDPRRLAGWFRSHEPTDDEAISPQDVRLFAVAAELGEVGGFLWRSLKRGSPKFEKLQGTEPLAGDAGAAAWRDGYRLGERARVGLTQVPGGPLQSVQTLLEDMGVHVARVEFESITREAVTIYRRGALPVMLLNTNTKRVRAPLSRRAIMGHELCHLLFDSGERHLTNIDGNQTPLQEQLERRANGFAPAFLAPPTWIRESYEPVEGDDEPALRELVANLARTWGFTGSGALWHAKNCNLVSKQLADALGHESAMGSLTPHEHSFEADRDDYEDDETFAGQEVTSLCAGLMERLAILAANEGVISTDRAREILSWS